MRWFFFDNYSLLITHSPFFVAEPVGDEGDGGNDIHHTSRNPHQCAAKGLVGEGVESEEADGDGFIKGVDDAVCHSNGDTEDHVDGDAGKGEADAGGEAELFVEAGGGAGDDPPEHEGGDVEGGMFEVVYPSVAEGEVIGVGVVPAPQEDEEGCPCDEGFAQE